MTSDVGTPVGDDRNTLSVGPSGALLVQDTRAAEKLARFDRERTPERVVHARGTGAHGTFVSYGDLSALTSAGFLGGADRETEVFVRFSTVIHGKGSPESLRDPRGFAVKFKIAEKYGGGIWDLVGNNLDVFFIRDQVSFPDMVHSLKPGTLGGCALVGVAWWGWLGCAAGELCRWSDRRLGSRCARVCMRADTTLCSSLPSSFRVSCCSPSAAAAPPTPPPSTPTQTRSPTSRTPTGSLTFLARWAGRPPTC